MANLNNVSLSGRLTATPELKQTNSGKAVTSFCVAVDRVYDRANPPEQTADFINCTAWGKTAEFVSKYFDKGSQIIIRGRLTTRSWTDTETNKKRSVTEVVAEDVYFCGSKGDNANTAEDKSKATKTKAKTKPNDTSDFDESSDGEIPF